MHTTPLDLNLLRVFDAVMETHSISLAAHRIGLTQSSTSHALNRLREYFGDPLFVRARRVMEPTPRAIELARPISEALATLSNIVQRPRDFDPMTSTRTFSIAMTDIGQTMYLPRLVAYFNSMAPGVNLVVQQFSRHTLRDRVESGSVDLAIGPFTGLQAGFYQQRLYKNSWVCAFRRNHPRLQDGLTLEQFLSESHLLVAPPGTGEDGGIEAALGHLGRKRRIALRVPNFHVASKILSQSDLIASVPQAFLNVESSNQTMRWVELPFATQEVIVRQFWHERYHEDPENRWLRRITAELFGSER